MNISPTQMAQLASLSRTLSGETVVEHLGPVIPALEMAMASAHEAGDERAVRILHAVLALLDDPALR